MFEVTSCCGCSSLKTGTIIIGVIQIIISIMLMVLCLNIRWELLTSLDPDTVKIIYTTSFCIGMFISILLLVGVFNRNTFMMLPWLVLGGIGAVSGLINTICKVIVCFVKDNPSCFAHLVGSIAGLMIYLHLWRVVYSYFKQLKNETMINYQQQA